MNNEAARALDGDRVIDITTIRRQSGSRVASRYAKRPRIGTGLTWCALQVAD